MKHGLPYKKLPETPGVYLMKDRSGKILYIGKAGNLRRRVSSYFTRPHDYRIQKLISEIARVNHKKTETALEALILESALIKRYQPLYNIREKDDKSFLYVEITREAYPRILLVRGKELGSKKPLRRFGPFINTGQLREALRILRRIFPYSTHPPEKISSGKPCFDYQIGLCPGTCTGAIGSGEYKKNIAKLILFFEGKKKRVIQRFEREMAAASKALAFERAADIKHRLFALKHIQDIALIADAESLASGIVPKMRIEGYDISNISGTSAVGSMVVFEGAKPKRGEYRKFKIQNFSEPNDVGMLGEMLRRRFRRASEKESWPLPYLLLIDGGKPQVNAAHAVLAEYGLKIPVVGIAKGPTRKENKFIGAVPRRVEPETLIRVRDEAHRFAISYHKKVRSRRFLSS